MKKIYTTPEIEVSKFSLAADILDASEILLQDYIPGDDDVLSGGWGWGAE